ncbi:caveolin-1-like [Babylonia areolata]|uniref:caveolin-1-like n=1 Tax=Babylonia areolata TaxID=304850 RepID=UPI003FD497E2
MEDVRMEPQPNEGTARNQNHNTVDLQDRDPNHLNTHLKLNFDDIFAEPNTSFISDDRVWTSSFKVYRCTNTVCYRILSFIFAVPATICWGVSFACLACCSIWCWHPCIRSLGVKMHYVNVCCSLWVNACVRPIAEALCVCFNNIRVSHKNEAQPGFNI